jgi:hypothetical protein
MGVTSWRIGVHVYLTGIGREGSFLGRGEDTGPAVGDCASGIAGGRRRSLRKARGIRDTGPADAART